MHQRPQTRAARAHTLQPALAHGFWAAMRLDDLLAQAPRIREIASEHGATNLAAFGSVAHDQARPILTAIRRVQGCLIPDRETFLAGAVLQDAVVRNLEIIGEASKRLSDYCRLQHPQIPWWGNGPGAAGPATICRPA